MSWFRAYPYVRFLIYFVIGILLEYFFQTHTIYSYIFLFFLIVTYIYADLSKTIKKWWQTKPIILGINAALILILLGNINTHLYIKKNNSNHIFNQKNEIIAYTAIITQEVEPRTKTYRTIASIQEIKTEKGWQKAKGDVLLYIQKDTNNSKKLQYGDLLVIKKIPQQLSKPANPYQFDYAQYLSWQNIYHQNYLQSNDFQYIKKTTPNYLLSISFDLRKWCADVLKKYIPNEREASMSIALILGVREQMEDEVLQAYSATGLMHVLAVSGMHVALIVTFLNLTIFRKMYKTKNSKVRYIYGFVMIVLMWAYAFITGLTPSVLRAVTMFTFVTLGNSISIKSSMYNNLAVSAFVLFCFNPLLIFSAGLQLSYAAVWGILYFQPKIAFYWQVNNKILKFFWDIITVSLAAQIGTLPIMLWYFHQFPNYFLIANLLIIPISTIALYAGIGILVFSWLPYVNVFLGYCTYYLIASMNYVTFGLQNLPYAVSDGIFINNFEMFLLYGMIICWVYFIEKKEIKYWYFLGGLVFIWGISRFTHIYLQNTKDSMILYHFHQKTGLHITQNKKDLIIADTTLDKKNWEFATKTYWAKIGTQKPIFKTWNANIEEKPYQFLGKMSVLEWKNKSFLIIHQKLRKKEWQNLKNIQPDFVIIRKNSLFSWEQIPENWTKTTFIFDGSNGLKRVKKLEQEKTTQKTYFTHWQGAWIF